MIPEKGTKAPAFSLQDQEEKVRKLTDYKGGWLLLYFYPRDNTSGCTIEACNFEKVLPDLNTLDVQVVGVSTDTVVSHQKFVTKYNLTFPLLADTEKEMVQQYGVWKEKKMMGKKYFGIVRTSFLINPDGVIEKVYKNVKAKVHVDEVLRDLKELQA